MRNASITRRFLTATLAAITFLSWAPTVGAQDRLIVFGQEVGALGRFGQKLGDMPPWMRRNTAGDPEWIAGGRYLKTTEYAIPESPELPWGSTTRIIETASGREVAAWTAAAFTPSGVVVDPIRPRVFRLDGEFVRVLDLDTGVSRVLAEARSVPGTPVIGLLPTGPPPSARYAQNVDRLFVRRANSTTTAWEVAVLNATSGAVVQTLPDVVAVSIEGEWLVTPNGARLFTSGGGNLRAVDTATGDVVSTVEALYGGRLRWDDRFQRLYLVSNQAGALKAFDGRLALLGQLDGGYCFSNVRSSPHTGRLYHLRAAGGAGSYYGAIDTRLEVWDGATGARLNDTSVTTTLGFGTDRPACSDYTMLLATAPGAPRGLAASVAGRDVTLSFTNVGDATAFVLDVGLAPGRTNATLALGATAPVTLTNAPSGTYHLRVRGTNQFGASRPSNEVVVVVP